MLESPTPEQVHLSLALRGDPTAFMTLVGPRLRRVRAALVAKGTSQPDADAQVSRFALELYHALTRSPLRTSFDEWFAKRLAQSLPSIAEGLAEAGEPLGDELEHELEQTLQREYSALNRRSRRRNRSAPATAAVVRGRGPRWILPVVLCAVVVVLVLLQVLWRRSGTTLELRRQAPDGARSTVLFPLGGVSDARESDSSAAPPANVQADTASASDSAAVDSAAPGAVTPPPRPSKPIIKPRPKPAPKPVVKPKPRPAPKPSPKPARTTAPTPPPEAPGSTPKPAPAPKPAPPKPAAEPAGATTPVPEPSATPATPSEPEPEPQPAPSPAPAPPPAEPATGAEDNGGSEQDEVGGEDASDGMEW